MIERIGTEFRERHKMSDFYKKFIQGNRSVEYCGFKIIKFYRKFLTSLSYRIFKIFLDSCGVATSLPNSFAILMTLSTNSALLLARTPFE